MGINFPASPTLNQKYPQPAVAGIPVYTWDGEKWTTVGGSIAAYAPPADAVPLMDATPGLVGTTTEYAREDHVHPTDTTRASAAAVAEVMPSALAYSGMQINGGMEVSQERGQNSSTGGFQGSARYICDGWNASLNLSVASGSGWQVTNIAQAPPGYTSFIQLTPSAAINPMGATEYLMMTQPIEGYRLARLGWGQTTANSLTIAFWVKVHTPGTYSMSLVQTSTPQSYSVPYTVNAADTWEFKTVTITPPAADGSWATGNTTGVIIVFALAAGTSATASVANQWLPSYFYAAPGSKNTLLATDYLNITGVTVLPGTQAPTAAQSPNIMRPYDQELVTCTRYYQKYSAAVVPDVSAINTFVYSTPMRVAPTITGGGAGFTVGGSDQYSMWAYQTGQAAQILVLDARL